MLSKVIRFSFQDLVSLPPAKLSPEAKLFADSTHLTLKLVLPSKQWMNRQGHSNPHTPDAAQYLTGMMTNEYVPRNMNVFPIPWATLLVDFSDYFVNRPDLVSSLGELSVAV